MKQKRLNVAEFLLVSLGIFILSGMLLSSPGYAEQFFFDGHEDANRDNWEWDYYIEGEFPYLNDIVPNNTDPLAGSYDMKHMQTDIFSYKLYVQEGGLDLSGEDTIWIHTALRFDPAMDHSSIVRIMDLKPDDGSSNYYLEVYLTEGTGANDNKWNLIVNAYDGGGNVVAYVGTGDYPYDGSPMWIAVEYQCDIYNNGGGEIALYVNGSEVATLSSFPFYHLSDAFDSDCYFWIGNWKNDQGAGYNENMWFDNCSVDDDIVDSPL